MSSNQRLRFGAETWQKGTRGLLSASATDKPVIRNMRYWANGKLGPRPEWTLRAFDPSTEAYDENAQLFPTRLGTVDEAYASTVGVVAYDDTQSHFYGYDDTAFAYAADPGSAFGNAFNWGDPFPVTETLWLCLDTQLLMKRSNGVAPNYYFVYDVGAAIKTAFGIGGSEAFLCTGSVVHQGRAYYWGYTYVISTGALAAPDTSMRVYYSDSAIVSNPISAYRTFSSAAQFFDIDGLVRGCVSVGSNLFIWSDTGKWSMMQGSGDPSDATFNDLGRARIPSRARGVAELDRAGIFLSSDGNSLVTLTSGGTIDDIPLSYLGFERAARDYVEYNSKVPNVATSSIQNSTTIAYLYEASEGQAQFPYPAADTTNWHARNNYNSVWTEEIWSTPKGEFMRVFANEYDNLECMFVYNGPVVDEWALYTRPIRYEFPSPTTAAESGNAISMGHLELPRIFEPSKQVRVKRVIVDGVAYNKDDANNPAANFEILVADGTPNSTSIAIGPGTIPFQELADDEEWPRRFVGTCPPLPYTHFSDVKITKIEGFAIESVTVEFEVSEGPIQYEYSEGGGGA